MVMWSSPRLRIPSCYKRRVTNFIYLLIKNTKVKSIWNTTQAWTPWRLERNLKYICFNPVVPAIWQVHLRLFYCHTVNSQSCARYLDYCCSWQHLSLQAEEFPTQTTTTTWSMLECVTQQIGLFMCLLLNGISALLRLLVPRIFEE